MMMMNKKRNLWKEATYLFTAHKYVTDIEKNEFGK
jgi:hypothetical protein